MDFSLYFIISRSSILVIVSTSLLSAISPPYVIWTGLFSLLLFVIWLIVL